MKKITVLLADDHAVVRQGLRAVLAAEEDIEVVGEAENGHQAVTLAKTIRPNVVIMDLAMPQLNGMEATRQILRSTRTTKVLVLSSYGDEECVSQMLEAGAVGYVIKHSAASDLSKAIREVSRGNGYFSPAIAKRLHDRERGGSGTVGGLTVREAEVLQLVAEGFSNKQAAKQLGISVKTIEKHRQQLMNKLNIHETAGLTRYAISRNIVEGGRPETFRAAA